MPFGGKYHLTPAEGMAAKIPVVSGETNTGTIMTYGYDPYLSHWSPFHGAMYAVVEAVTKVVVMGGDYSKIRLTFQEYFENLGVIQLGGESHLVVYLEHYMLRKNFGYQPLVERIVCQEALRI